ncbi:hypothetical protein S40285_10531 [Stachybotrys chlorohalonatus IBT 40285]|uniref:Uncharacterized protein n=1 Tax=Stachybotrys chlorohalonatus (strain IBT 40285) TaxID=1283841 RepID=A0A084Q8W3_STAC4|nr:hypothetical protein S40285_10531 [Stachybotrys chlorohalonata IBT 40285]
MSSCCKKTWTEEISPYSWLRDAFTTGRSSLSLMARVMSFTYNSKVQCSEYTADVFDFAGMRMTEVDIVFKQVRQRVHFVGLPQMVGRVQSVEDRLIFLLATSNPDSRETRNSSPVLGACGRILNNQTFEMCMNCSYRWLFGFLQTQAAANLWDMIWLPKQIEPSCGWHPFTTAREEGRSRCFTQ